MKNVMVRIEASQRGVDGEENTMEFITEGKQYMRNGAMYLVYKESEISGMEGSTTTLKLEEDQVKMKRFGSTSSDMIFKLKERYTTKYNTPYGNFKMEIYTKKIEQEIGEDQKAKIYVEYMMSIQGLVESTNKLNISIM
ncbi:MAG: DUF1934 domain-containing protein [Anaeromicrobium sp.]|jgi:uncharacterized beta-barrel protein YwiB (DUF1934 family)|uniref:DUF1934 domain-containing protein n=1 Tax=Anaeromicrobium sp. TaxID=1929132 RepID=UPI0026008866|nr:DUF1934 domain-containing protein [Anaeromicrobium sp.]MCT4593730.1 DUF1934 domain-containing protein [Anaeromicrobium sp.]